MAKRSIPQIREGMYKLADDLELSGLRGYAARLRRMATETKRSVNAPRAPVKQKRITAQKVRAVRRHKRLYPAASHVDMALLFGLENGGRVSEILFGKRGVPMYDDQGRKIKR